ncbi:Gfo/Idh/MocA family oxidoreductase [bacterium]|jgi:predicted dehydrogenase|nr:Gfo/Idh/MocA family oxidoreductase [bacterium]
MSTTYEYYSRNRRRKHRSLTLNRRDFMRASLVVPAGAALYFGYSALRGNPVRAGIVGTGNEGCQAMIDQSPPGYLKYVAYHDIRPSQIARGRRSFVSLYGPAEGNTVRFFDKYEAMLADPEIEAIVIATPLWTHAKLAIQALKAGKHVFCEKLMAHNITEAKAMVRAADQAGKLLGIGHQRHYSLLYADAVKNIEQGALGEVKFIRAFWHRNNALLDPKTNELRDAWKPTIPTEDEAIRSHVKDWGYDSLEQLVRWRLFDRTGGGLMAELGSHQLDACSIFLGHEHPVAVSGLGGVQFYKDDREAFDHVYCNFEFAGGKVVSYSSINTNQMEGYGEVVMGTRGTMMVLNERDVSIYNESDPKKKERAMAQSAATPTSAADTSNKAIKETTKISKPGEATMYSAASTGGYAAAASKSSEVVSRGYKEELEHFAYCIRHPEEGQKLRCDGRVGLADAVMALAANVAIKKGQRLEFKESWYDPASTDVPDEVPKNLDLARSVPTRQKSLPV